MSPIESYYLKASCEFDNHNWKSNQIDLWNEILSQPEKEWINPILNHIGHAHCEYDGSGIYEGGKDYYFVCKTYQSVLMLKEILEKMGLIVEYHKDN